METETKAAITATILIVTMLTSIVNLTILAIIIKEAREEIKQIETKSGLLVSTTIDTIYEQCTEEGNITITAQETLEGKTAKLTKTGEGTCAIEIKEQKQTE